MTLISQAGEATFQLINDLSVGGSTGGLFGSYTNTYHEVWYLFGYPDDRTRDLDGTVISATADAGGTAQNVTVKTAQRFTGLLLQAGSWVLVRIPAIIDDSGGLVLNPNLIDDGFMRLIYDFTTNLIAISKFITVQRMQIFDLSNTLIFDGAPSPGLPPITPTVTPDPDQANDYEVQGVHFDGATGLVTAKPLATQNTGKISFAGWFLMDPSLSGTLEFSQGSGNNTIVYDTSLPAPSWCHLMGTIDAAANTAFLFNNAATASGNPTASGSAFSAVSTDGKNVYIGTDTQGNFFKGDIADLSIWYDFSFLDNLATTIPKLVFVSETLGGVVSIAPKNPALSIFGFNTKNQPFQQGDQVNNVTQVRAPDIFLSGPANTALTPMTQTGTLVQNIHTLKVVSGALTNSATNPGKITIVPA